MSVAWNDVLHNLDTQNSWEALRNIIRRAEERAVPKKRRRVKNRPLWMRQNVIRVVRKKKRLWKMYQATREYEEYLAYKNVEKEVRGLVPKAKRKFERKLAKEAKRKPKLFYSYIKSKMANRQSVGQLKEKTPIMYHLIMKWRMF